MSISIKRVHMVTLCIEKRLIIHLMAISSEGKYLQGIILFQLVTEKQ